MTSAEVMMMTNAEVMMAPNLRFSPEDNKIIVQWTFKIKHLHLIGKYFTLQLQCRCETASDNMLLVIQGHLPFHQGDNIKTFIKHSSSLTLGLFS